MVTLAAHAFGAMQTARKLGHWPELSDDSLTGRIWHWLAFHGHHPPWNSQFYFLGMTYWDLVQTGFMFMVGVAMPYSYASRLSKGQSTGKLFGHACLRGAILVLLGIFLQTRNRLEVNTLFSKRPDSDRPGICSRLSGSGLETTQANSDLRRSTDGVLGFAIYLAGPLRNA